jgi:predicted outer membrane protein
MIALLLLALAGLSATALTALTALTASAAPPTPDATYLNAAHQFNLTIIAAAHAANAQGSSSCVRTVAVQLERDHRKLAAQEAQLATRFGLKLPTLPSTAQLKQLDAVGAKSATPAYDAAWLALQRQQHQQYLALINGDVPKASSPAVESLAEGAKPVVQMHLQMMTPTCRLVTSKPVVPTGDGGQVADAQKARSRAALVLLGIGAFLLLVGKQKTLRRRALGVAAVAAGLVMVFGMPGNTGKVPQAGGSTAELEAAVPPVRLKLQGVDNAPVQAVATGSDGQLQMPTSPNAVGWWAAGAAPGSEGGTVLLAGHVDTARSGRAVFAGLSAVPVGAKVSVTGGDGHVHRYKIVARRTYLQSALPRDLFQGAGKPRLVLVTCTGSYDHKAHRYTHNLVLYGVPVV